MTEEKASTTLPGKVERLIKPLVPGECGKAEISVDGADPLYGEIRIENIMINAQGETISLRPGAEVVVTIEADPEDTTVKKLAESTSSQKMGHVPAR